MALPDAAYRWIGRFSVSRFDRRLHPWLYRRFGGRGPLGRILGCEMVILTTIGRSSGADRSVALFAFPMPGRAGWAVIGSRGGSGSIPAWARNLEVTPRARLSARNRRIDVVARAAEGDEYEAIFERAAAAYPGYRLYRREARHRIPIVVLEPDR